MITNTQRLLYNIGYVPAYAKNTKHRVEFNGFYYDPKFEEVETDRVWKVELDNCCVSYFSQCNIKTSVFGFTPIEKLKIGDIVYTYLAGNQFFPYKDQELVKLVVRACLGEAKAAKQVTKMYKIKSLKDFKLLKNNLSFIGDFICELTKNLRQPETDSIRFYHAYEFLQELHLALTLFGIPSMLRKEGNFWFIEYSYEVLENIITSEYTAYVTKPIKILSIKEIKQKTQSFKVTNKIKKLVVNSVVIEGD